MPVWHEKTRQLVADGKLVVLGVAQEQHPDRCRLFAQWKGIDWPILHDPLNLVGIAVVPMLVAVDEHGIVRAVGGNLDEILESFVDKAYEPPAEPVETGSEKLPNTKYTRRTAKLARTSVDFRKHGDALVLAGLSPQIDEAIQKAYQRAIELAGKEGLEDADAHFRLGVAYRLRYDLHRRRPGDFQAAIDAWQTALALRPNQYIFRRRIQQYGPRLDKPYPFYDWVATAREEITARGGAPIALAAEPIGAERAGRDRKPATDTGPPPEGDPGGKINRDKKGLIRIETAVVRGTGQKRRRTFQVHLTFQPDAERGGHWSNEAEPLRVWIDKVKGTKLSGAFLEHANPPRPVTGETRTLSFEVRLSKKKKSATLNAYALYNTCEGTGGKCQFLRQDIRIKLKAR